MATGLDILKRALRLLNVLATTETPDGTTTADALTVLNAILDEWSIEKLMGWSTDIDTYTLTANTGVYTIGSGADLDGLRPIKIESAFIRDSNNLDTKLELIDNYKYQEIRDKTLASSYPCYLFYNPTYPLGTISLYPYPTTALTLGISHYNQITRFSVIGDTLSMPLGYEIALGYQLAGELALEYGKDPSPFMQIAQAKKSKLKNVNSMPSLLKCDIATRNVGKYNAYTDSWDN